MKPGGSGRRDSAAAPYLVPAAFIILFILVFPILYGLIMGFTDRLFPYDNYAFIGLKNFREILRDPLFWKSLSNTFWMILWTVVFNTLLGFGLALLLNSRKRYTGFFRAVYFMPWILPSTVVAFSFRWLYNDFYGLLNRFLVEQGILAAAINPLAYQDLVWPAVIIPGVWFSYPFVMLVMASALRSVDPGIVEAARMDGAGAWRVFWSITLPIIRPSLVMLTLLQVIWEAASFDLIYLLTRGGPANATLTLSLYIYRRAFEQKQIGYASALASVLFITILLFIGMYLRLSARAREDADEH